MTFWSNVIRLLHHDRGLEFWYMAHLETWWDMVPQGHWFFAYWQVWSDLLCTIKLNHNNFPFSLVDNSKIKIQDIQKYNSLNWKHSNMYVYPISVVFWCFYFWITVLHFQRRLKVLQLKHFGLNWGIPTPFKSICSFENRTWNSKKWNFDRVPNFSCFGIFSQNHLYFQRWQIVLIYVLCCILTSLVSKMGSFIFQLWTVVLWWLITWGVISWNNTGTEIGYGQPKLGSFCYNIVRILANAGGGEPQAGGGVHLRLGGLWYFLRKKFFFESSIS